MSSQLTKAGVQRALTALSNDLPPRKMSQLRAIVERLDPEGHILIDDALEAMAAAGTSIKPDSLRQFRSEIDKAVADAGIDFTMVADRRSSRWLHFEGKDRLAQELAQRSEREARRALPKALVAATAQESGPYRVYVSAPLDDNLEPDPQAETFIKELKQALSTLPKDPGYEISSTYDTVIGDNPDVLRPAAVRRADVTVVLLSPDYLIRDSPERTAVLESSKPRIKLFLKPVMAGANLIGFDRNRMLFDKQPWNNKRSTERARAISDVIANISQHLPTSGPHPEQLAPEDLINLHNQWQVREIRGGIHESEHHIPAHASESRFDVTSPQQGRVLTRDEPNDASLPHGRQVPAIARLVEWVTDPNPQTPRFTALLGDVGMGKSTTFQQLTLHLLELRETEISVPLPVLFDLKLLGGHDVDVMELPQLLEIMLRHSSNGRSTATAADILELARQGNCLLIFDGLDELLVHLSDAAGKRLIRRLWQTAGDEPSTRLAISCRTHYFRTLRDEVSVFLGQSREGIEGNDYLVLHMLPFSEVQIREYICKNINQDRVDQIMGMIDAVYNLRELASQPMLLRMIARLITDLEHRIASGRPVRSADLYQSFAEQWLSRDDGKHQLIPDHKMLLMENLAAQLWRAGRRTWKATDLENWMLRFLHDNPDLELHYERRMPELWKEDLRTATFVTRSGEDYGFAHTSLLEFFLAKHLLRLLLGEAADAQQDWAELRPSAESDQFLAELLLSQHVDDQHHCMITLQKLGQIHKTGERILRFAITSAIYGLEVLDLKRLNVSERSLDDLRFGGENRMNLHEANFDGASLRRARFQNISLGRASFTAAHLIGASFENCAFTGCNFNKADLAGATFRRCDLYESNIRKSYTIETHFIANKSNDTDLKWSTPKANAISLKAPIAFINNFTRLTHGGFSPDSTLILTTHRDGTARIWNTHTGQTLHTLTGHTNAITSGTFSPNGNLILTTSNDRTARIWNTHTGQTLHTLTGHTSGITHGTFSPTGLVRTAGLDQTIRTWDVTTGEQVGRQLDFLPESEVVVRDAVTQQVLGASDGAWRWLGHIEVRDGRPVRLPGELGGLFPPLSALANEEQV